MGGNLDSCAGLKRRRAGEGRRRSTAEVHATKTAPHCTKERVHELLQGTRMLPERWRGSGMVGAELASERFTAAVRFNDERAFW